jgi:hypothetical protein
VAQSTKELDWNNIELKVFGQSAKAQGFLCFPCDNTLYAVSVTKKGKEWVLTPGAAVKGVKMNTKAAF